VIGTGKERGIFAIPAWQIAWYRLLLGAKANTNLLVKPMRQTPSRYSRSPGSMNPWQGGGEPGISGLTFRAEFGDQDFFSTTARQSAARPWNLELDLPPFAAEKLQTTNTF
jgi:hypothetical protein